jgi:cytochrome c biogenesis protein CcmG/thiol:disulfide interchange protein DsbE
MDKLDTLVCPNCGGTDLTKVDEETYRCNHCNTSSVLEKRSDQTFILALATAEGANATASAPVPARRLSWGRVLVWVGLLALLVIVGLGLMRTQQGSASVGQRAPDFTLTTFDGQNITLSDLKGKVVLVNFWASWCKPCEQEAADLESAWRFYQPRGDVVFLGVDWTDTDSAAQDYLKKFDISYTNGPDLGTRISQKYRITGVPETYIVDQNGMISFTKISPFASLDEIKAAIHPLLKP